MTLNITTNFYPYRLILKRKEPVELRIELTNKGEKDKMISMQLLLDKNLALDKSGLKSNVMEKINPLPPNEKKTFIYSVYPKGFAQPGTYVVKVKTQEHYQNFSYAEKEYVKTLELVVDN